MKYRLICCMVLATVVVMAVLSWPPAGCAQNAHPTEGAASAVPRAEDDAPDA